MSSSFIIALYRQIYRITSHNRPTNSIFVMNSTRDFLFANNSNELSYRCNKNKYFYRSQRLLDFFTDTCPPLLATNREKFLISKIRINQIWGVMFEGKKGWMILWNRFKIGKTFINYLKTMKQGEHEIDNSISNIIK